MTRCPAAGRATRTSPEQTAPSAPITTTPSYTQDMPACGQCGENNPPEARLCWSCGTALPAVDRPGGEERRIVTVLFVDLVDFTSISTRLDPEDLRRVQAPYFRRVRAELERFGGHVEKYIG